MSVWKTNGGVYLGYRVDGTEGAAAPGAKRGAAAGGLLARPAVGTIRKQALLCEYELPHTCGSILVLLFIKCSKSLGSEAEAPSFAQRIRFENLRAHRAGGPAGSRVLVNSVDVDCAL